MKGRLYDPKVGRFLMTDPIVSHPGFGQSWNPYSYVLNNPLAFTDPSGFEDTAPEWLIPSPCGSDCVQSPDGTLKAWHTPLLPEVPPAPNVEASLAGLTTVPVDLSATGNVTASTPQAPLDGGGGGGGAGQSLALSAGGGGADSGARTQARLTPADYAAFRQGMNEQARQYAVMAALAPVRYPVVVGVLAFGLLNPDPAYAPTFQTAPEDRPSVLERAGETGLAVAAGAIGIKLGQVGSVAATAPKAYSVAFEMKLTPAQYGLPRAQHFETARQALRAAMIETPELVSLVGGPGNWGKPPVGWTWHHDIQVGIMQLVPRVQHTPGSPFWGVLHPGGVGGYSAWAIPAGAPQN